MRRPHLLACLVAALAPCGASPALCQEAGQGPEPPPAPRDQRSAGVQVLLDDPVAAGTLRLLLFDAADAFGDLRNPLRTVVAEAGDGLRGSISGIQPGTYALLVHCDENGNGLLDRNFIGIPTEPIGFSNRYVPKGPPAWARARFELRAGESRTFRVGLSRLLGKRGVLGLGLATVGQSSPYRGSSGSVLRVFPALTYTGERLQLLGPILRYGLVGSDDLRLAATARFRIGAYEEDDSDVLRGLGDRDDTLMGGLALIKLLPAGLRLRLGYEHDLLDRIGGGAAQLDLERSFQLGITRVSPQVGLRWQSAELANNDFGVPSSKAGPNRPAYDPGDTLSVEAGLSGFIELSRSWRLLVSLSVEFLDEDVRDSPIVGKGEVLKGFLALSYAF